MRLYRQTLEDFSLYPGLELEDKELSQLRKAAGMMSAKMRAVRIVSASSVSKGDLQQRLIHKGETAADAAEAIRWMEELDLLDDRKTAQQVVQRCISKGYGIARAKQALYEKRIPKIYWDEVLEDYPEQIDVVAEYVKSHLTNPKDPKQVRKITDALMRRGHSYRTVRQALDLASVDEDFLEDF